MYTKHFEFAGAKGTVLPGILWLPEEHPKLLLQITHGMTEHIGRYGKLAEILTSHGIAVAGFDLRGHGKNSGSPTVASFGQNGWKDSLEDIHLFYHYSRQQFPDIEHYMLGFSLGSFLLREYLSKYSDPIAGAIIMGTGHQPSLVLTIMMAIVNGQIKKSGFDQTTPLVRKLSFGTYNQKFAPNRTSADWLCADDNQLEEYLTDPLCRSDISSGLFWQLLGAMKRTGGDSVYEHWDKQMPVLLLSGQEDPVGSFGKGIQQVYENMKKGGLTNVEMHLLKNARHDLLHEEKSGAASSVHKILIEWMFK